MAAREEFQEQIRESRKKIPFASILNSLFAETRFKTGVRTYAEAMHEGWAKLIKTSATHPAVEHMDLHREFTKVLGIPVKADWRTFTWEQLYAANKGRGDGNKYTSRIAKEAEVMFLKALQKLGADGKILHTSKRKFVVGTRRK